MANNNYGVGGYGLTGYGNAPVSLLPVGYYLNLLTQQYGGSPSFTAWMSTVLQVFNDIATCAQSMEQAFNLNLAVGAQLDTLGLLIGASRTLPFQPNGGFSPLLGDEDYRLLLRARVAFNHFNGELDSLQSTWTQLFPTGAILIYDQQSMSANIVLTGAFSSLQRDMITGGLIIPRPQGVEYTFTFASLPLLGFDENSATVAGFDQGKFA